MNCSICGRQEKEEDGRMAEAGELKKTAKLGEGLTANDASTSP
jgi:hypothetical protein